VRIEWRAVVVVWMDDASQAGRLCVAHVHLAHFVQRCAFKGLPQAHEGFRLPWIVLVEWSRKRIGARPEHPAKHHGDVLQRGALLLGDHGQLVAHIGLGE
jgi:hypothetical protein